MAAGADVRAKDNNGAEPLHHAAGNPTAEAAAAALHALVAAGADVRAKDGDGAEPLHSAARNESAEAAAAAIAGLAAEADVRARDNDGDEPLHWAAGNVSAKAASVAVQALLAAGADVGAQNTSGSTPLHFASAYGNLDAALALLAAGADLQAVNVGGETPLDLAIGKGHFDMAAAIVRAGPADAVLEALCSCSKLTDGAQQLFPVAIASHLPLSPRQWARIPAHHPFLSSALPTALAHSVDQASHLVCRLAPANAQRLRTFALCIGRLQGLAGGQEQQQHHEPLRPLHLPPTAVARILSYFDA